MGESPSDGDNDTMNPSQGEAEGWSPQRNVELQTSYFGPDAGSSNGDNDDDDSDKTEPMTPSPVKSVKASDSPVY